MNRYVFFTLFLGVILSCNDRNNEEPQLKKDNYHKQEKIEILPNTKELSPNRYLGKTFNLIDFNSNDVSGFCKNQVVDLNNKAWKPFSSTIVSDVKPENEIRYCDSKDIIKDCHKMIDKKALLDSIVLNSNSLIIDKNVLKYNKTSFDYLLNNSNVYDSYIYNVQKTISFDKKEPKYFECFLNHNFVEDLKSMPAEKLLEKYGTHIVSSYNLGVFMNLIVTTNSNKFSKDETKLIESKLWNKKNDLPIDLKDKIKKNTSNISIIYKQGGSNYNPSDNIFVLDNLYSETSQINALSEKDWENGIREDDNTFLSINRNGGLIPIPDLISDIPLKIKYFSAIVYKTILKDKHYGMIYVLCSPKTFEPILYKGKIVNTTLGKYIDSQVSIFEGLGSNKILTESYLEGSGDNYNNWDAKLMPNGLWTFKNWQTNKYLCVDFKLRTELEDSENTRYWLINPIVPTEDGNQMKMKNLFIKKIKR